MKVFLVFSSRPEDGTRPLGIFTTRAAAEACQAALQRNKARKPDAITVEAWDAE